MQYLSKNRESIFNVLNYRSFFVSLLCLKQLFSLLWPCLILLLLSVRPSAKCASLSKQMTVRPVGRMSVRKNRKNRPVRETKIPIAFELSREFTSPLLVLTIAALIVFPIRNQFTRVKEISTRSTVTVIHFIYGV
jgi:hypothetical protein